MKTFLKVVLLVIAAVVAVKLLPLTFAIGVVLGLGVVALAVVGVSVLAGLAALVVVLAAVLAPIWIPVLALVGLIALIRRSNRTTTA